MPDLKLKIIWLFAGTTNLVTLTGTNYYWSKSPTSLTYYFERSINSGSTWTTVTTSSKTNPAYGSSTSYTYQIPTNRFSGNVTNTYTKYNKEGKKVSRKTNQSEFKKKNVSSSAGAIPKVAKLVSPKPKVKSKAQLPKYVRDINVLITPATVRGFDTRTERIKDMSIKYDELVKKYAKDIIYELSGDKLYTDYKLKGVSSARLVDINWLFILDNGKTVNYQEIYNGFK